AMTGEGYWSAENKIYSTVALKPVVTSGADALVLEDNTGVFFNWKNGPGATPFTTPKTFTFEFDAELTGGEGDKDACSGRSRSLYVGFGGWYNLFEVHTADDGESAGAVISGSDAKAPWGDNYKNIHVKIEWQGTTATTTITDKNGNLLLTGKRTHSSFTNMEDKYMNAMGIRCEDGKAVIDNFKFKVTDTAVVASKEVNIPSGKQAYYECDIACSNANSTRITLSGNDVFGYNNGALTLGAKGIKGTFNPGIYNFKMWINPVQNMVTTEAISPDGEIVSRAIYTLSDAFTNGDDIMVFSDAADPILKEKLEYLTVNKSAYQIVNEPAYTGYEEKVHNVVTSFIENAATDRAFAWTAMANYIGTSDMAVKYRPQGASAWQEVTATKVQNDHVANEEYFKADIYDLTPETTYEYKIGKKGAGDSDWSKTYTFKTAATEIDEFTFVAVGDTQGEGWTGRGFQFARAALDEAFKENSDAAFMLHTGDIVETGTNIGMWNTYFKALGEYGTKYPHFATMGNHITYGNDYTGIDNWNNHFNHPNNDTAPIDISKTTGLTDSALKHLVNNYANGETIYSFDYGNAHFIVLNTGAFSKAQDDILMKAQREWLEKDLEAHKDATWTIVLQHQTVYHRIGDTSNYDRQALADLLEEEYGVDLVLQGHSHLVTRTYPMMNRQIVTKEYDKVIPKGIGTVYMTIGSTTTNHDGVPDTINDEEIFKMAVPMSESDNRPTRSMPAYTTVKITDEELKLVIKQADGLILDEFTIKGECNHVPGDWETVVEPTTLAPGKQELRCGKCGALMETKELPKLVEIPKTGDDTNLYLLFTALMVSSCVIVMLTINSKKRRA
ncbi:MAG: metallophosphoesterase family protein, partial [Clostridia bacterium]|nr:metallophosphoesterase family protein [Clostridia bacterium]